MLKIKTVDKKTYGRKQLGLEPGDAIISFDGYKTQDLLDYVYYDAKECFTMEVFTKDGETVTVDVDKYEDESLGLLLNFCSIIMYIITTTKIEIIKINNSEHMVSAVFFILNI